MYIQAMFINKYGDALHTHREPELRYGTGGKDTEAKFEALKATDCDLETAPFMIDLWRDNDELIDTIGLSRESYVELLGEPLLTAAEYEKINSDVLSDVLGE